MFHVPCKPFLIAVACVSICFNSVIISSADGLASLAAAAVRDKNYGDAYAAARKCAESPQRSFLLGVAALRLGRGDEALPLLVEAEQKLPLVADYAALYQAEALMKQKRYAEATAKAMSVPRTYPGTLLVRRADKLAADSMFGGGDYRGALKAYQTSLNSMQPEETRWMPCSNRHAAGRRSATRQGAAQVFRSIWLNNPASAQALQSQERMAGLGKSGVRAAGFTPDELLRRASVLFTLNEFTAALKSLAMIPTDGQPPGFASRVDFRTGMTHYRLRNFKLAEKYFLRASAGPAATISDEARFWGAKSLERQDQVEQADAIYMELVDKGRKQEFADDALLEVAGMRKSMGNYAEAARLFELFPRNFPDSKYVPALSGRPLGAAIWPATTRWPPKRSRCSSKTMV